MNNIIKIILTPLLILLFAASCRNSDDLGINDRGKPGDKILTVRISNKGGISTRSTTRAGDVGAGIELIENGEALKFFLVGTDDDSNKGKVLAPPTEIEINKVEEGSKYEAKLRLDKSLDDIKSMKLVILANAEIALPNQGADYDQIKSGLISTFTNLWSDEKYIPMYGEQDIKDIRPAQKIIDANVGLTRALAKVELILSSETRASAKKITSIESVRIYRSLTKFNIAPDYQSNGQLDLNKPFIPSDAAYNTPNGGVQEIAQADANPLILVDGKKTCYIPEYAQAPNSKRSEVVTLVAGVKLEGVEQVKYVRLDFSDYNTETGKPNNFKNVLRNHHYKFDLQGVISPQDSPEEALDSPGSVWLDVQDYTDYNTDVTINGQYYFKIISSDIDLKSTRGDQVILDFETNIPSDRFDIDIKPNWSGEIDNPDPNGAKRRLTGDDVFEYEFDLTNNKLIVKTKIENTSNDDLDFNLILTALDHKFSFSVTQLHKSANYIIDQNPKDDAGNPIQKANGIYIRNVPMAETNTVTIRLIASNENEKIAGLKYRIYSNEVQGLKIDYKGVFPTEMNTIYNREYLDIDIPVLGVSDQPKNKTLTVITDGVNPTMGRVELPFAYVPKTILGLFGPNSKYSLDRNSNFKLLIGTDRNCFGTHPESTVKIEGITYIESSQENISQLIEQHKPDIIIWGAGYDLNEGQIETLVNFTKNRQNMDRGVVIGMTNSQYSLALMQGIGIAESESRIMPINTPFGGDRTFAFDRNDNGYEKYIFRYRMPVLDWDKISSGNFGAIGTMSIQLFAKERPNWWDGSDPSDDVYITGLKLGDYIKYSDNLPFAKRGSQVPNGVVMLRAYYSPFFWVGSNGFIYDDNQWGWSGYHLDSSPTVYRINSDSYLYKEMKAIYNSVAFGNILHWAFHSVEYGNK